LSTVPKVTRPWRKTSRLFDTWLCWCWCKKSLDTLFGSFYILVWHSLTFSLSRWH